MKCIDCGKEIKWNEKATCPECELKSYKTFNETPWQKQGVWLAERALTAEQEIEAGFREASKV